MALSCTTLCGNKYPFSHDSTMTVFFSFLSTLVTVLLYMLPVSLESPQELVVVIHLFHVNAQRE
jgi:hypothetical protein